MRGAKPKPTLLKVIAGNPGRRPLNKQEPKPSGDLKSPPDWLSPNQFRIWEQAIAIAPIGLLKQLDESVLLVWVIAKDLHQMASQQIAQQGMLVTASKSEDEIASPHMGIINKQALIMLKAASEMGFTPSSRSRVAIDHKGTEATEWDKF